MNKIAVKKKDMIRAFFIKVTLRKGPAGIVKSLGGGKMPTNTKLQTKIIQL